MIQLGNRVGSHDTGWDHMIQLGNRVGSHDTAGKQGGIT